MDRITNLLRHHPITAHVFYAGGFCGQRTFDTADSHGHIHLIRSGSIDIEMPSCAPLQISEPTLVLFPRAIPHALRASNGTGADLVCANVELGGAHSLLAQAFPPVLCIALAQAPGLGSTLGVLFDEAFAERCGRLEAIDRLCEVVLIQVLRHVMEEGLGGGMLAAMADPRLAKAMVAMHETPAQDWTLDRLAAVAGMSRARFAVQFRLTVGVTPGHYLAAWRVSVAQSLLAKGKPVGVVATDVGYANSSALSRVFRSHTGQSPGEWMAHRASTNTNA